MENTWGRVTGIELVRTVGIGTDSRPNRVPLGPGADAVNKHFGACEIHRTVAGKGQQEVRSVGITSVIDAEYDDFVTSES